VRTGDRRQGTVDEAFLDETVGSPVGRGPRIMSTIARLTIEQYDRMIAEGVFETTDGPRQRIELIEGELRTMSPIGPAHARIVNILTEWSFESLPRRQVWVRIQDSVEVPEFDSAPEPDLAWVERRSYKKRRPSGANVLLLIEVADSSLAYDCGAKANLYAAAGIGDYWVVDIPGECLHIFRQPESGRYSGHQTFQVADRVSPLAFPEIGLSVAALFLADDEGAEVRES
jgi:Uma2 family endonuclease